MDYKKLFWVLVSCLIVLSLVIVSCETKSEDKITEEDDNEDKITIIETETDGVQKEEEKEQRSSSDVPKYGGVITLLTGADPRGFDDVYGWNVQNYTLKLTHDELLTGDWTRGPAGTGEFEWATGDTIRIDSKAGSLAESWEIPETGTIIFHVRQGINFAVISGNEASALVNGREITADDIGSMLITLTTNPRSTLSRTESKNAVITIPDQWTVRIDLPEKSFAECAMLADYAITGYPKEVVETYGLPLSWEQAIGTGPFIMTDYVPSSSVILDKNPNYWMTDPIGLGQGNPLPYLDRVKILIVADSSTQLAAIRTAKIDIMHNVSWENAESLQQTSRDLVYKKFPSAGSFAIMMRTDKPELPFDDIKVRHALMMATDYETIKEEFCGGEAVILAWPITRTKEHADCYLPLEEAPESVKELYKYNPEKAKQLLTEAGYPDGFHTNIVVANSPNYVDYLSIIADQWSRVGIDLEIIPLDGGIMTGISLARSHEEMEFQSCGPAGNAFIGAAISTGTMSNGSYIDDPIVNEALAKIGPLSVSNTAEAARLYKELMAYVLEQAWALPSPATPSYHCWWPWVKNYHGEFSVGRENYPNFTKFVWIDEDMRQSMGY